MELIKPIEPIKQIKLYIKMFGLFTPPVLLLDFLENELEGCPSG
jgi:hypothetical protein